MIFQLLQIAPAVAFAWILAITIALTVHEFSHALAAKLRGDTTAEDQGRLTLNPLAHVDWIGMIAMLIVGFGWAKPVPYNPYNLKNPKWDSVVVGLAGPFSNLILAIVSGIALRVVLGSGGELTLLTVFLLFMVILNLFLLFFNIIPVHPLDGSKLFFAIFDKPHQAKLRQFVAVRGPQILMILVLASIVTNLDVFVFVSAPAFAVCDGLVGTNCSTALWGVFSL